MLAGHVDERKVCTGVECTSPRHPLSLAHTDVSTRTACINSSSTQISLPSASIFLASISHTPILTSLLQTPINAYTSPPPARLASTPPMITAQIALSNLIIAHFQSAVRISTPITDQPKTRSSSFLPSFLLPSPLRFLCLLLSISSFLY
ncbi:hypothetical protein BDQ12DRAFT_360124 [Crucibulum laeve]|uniref:Uncharacterized protein n=1 Tax=Crucibulum laeve TaxID=68775 RepID=A0A5C3LQP8_9AGAR|nr:hypothetical protein BDQ12DRAFT_360124 [Crucibulum laeve]